MFPADYAAQMLALPVGGIMSRHPVQKLAEEIHHFEQAAAELFAFPGNLLRFATSSLSVLPGYILTDRGIVDGKLQKFVDEQQSNTPQQADGASI